jgi:D-glycero-D-manno-heptose 1,7-bisphosphate phosphatase
MKNSWMIGDRKADIIAANTAGITNTILVRSGHKIDGLNSKAKYIISSIQQASKIITS